MGRFKIRFRSIQTNVFKIIIHYKLNTRSKHLHQDFLKWLKIAVKGLKGAITKKRPYGSLSNFVAVFKKYLNFCNSIFRTLIFGYQFKEKHIPSLKFIRRRRFDFRLFISDYQKILCKLIKN